MYNATNSAPHRPSSYRVDALRTLSLRSTAQLNDLFVNLLSRLVSAQRGVTRLASLPRNSTLRFVCYNASPRGSALHWAPRLPAAHLASTQLNDLFVTSLRVATLLRSARRIAPLCNSTICLLLRDATWLIASLRSSTQLNDLFVTSRRSAPLLPAGLRSAPPRNATICLLRRIAPRRSFPQLYTPFGSAPLRNATQRFVCQFIAAAQRSAPQLHATCRSAPASRLHASRGNLTLLNATN